MLQKKIEMNDNLQYACMAAVFVLFVIFYFIIKDLFIVFYTAQLGTAFCLISLSYFKITSLDILFEIEITEFDDLLNMDSK